MATKAYVGVGDKARQVQRMYVGVDGKARRVKKGYIGVNGVAKLFFTDGVEWKKYKCTVETETYEEEYTYYEEKEKWNSGASPCDSITGAANYSFDSKTGTFATKGSTVTFPGSYGHGGRVYSGGGDSIDVEQLFDDHGTWYVNTGTFTAVKRTGTDTKTRTTYTVGNSLGSVYADEGARPDSDKGYTYVTTYNGYTIMKSGNLYYAYKKA